MYARSGLSAAVAYVGRRMWYGCVGTCMSVR